MSKSGPETPFVPTCTSVPVPDGPTSPVPKLGCTVYVEPTNVSKAGSETAVVPTCTSVPIPDPDGPTSSVPTLDATVSVVPIYPASFVSKFTSQTPLVPTYDAPTSSVLSPSATPAPLTCVVPTFVPISDEPEFDEQNPYTPSNSFPHYAMYPTIDVSGIEYLTSHSANAASSRLQSTPVGPNDVLLCPPNPVREWNCCEDLLSRLEKQETENAELKRQQFDLMQRIEALENSAHNVAMYMPRAAAVDCELQEKFENKDLLRIKGSLFVVGQAITSDMCKELVLNLYENEPTLDYTVETIRTIN